jgi:hypothetical protein
MTDLIKIDVGRVGALRRPDAAARRPAQSVYEMSSKNDQRVQLFGYSGLP